VVHTKTDPQLSQGGQLVHNAANMLSAQDTAFVASTVVFGDPLNPKPVGQIAAANTKVICHTGDLICAQQSVILAPHLTYGRDAASAAAFVMSSTASGGAGGKKATRQIVRVA
jgi:cutinase